MEEESRKLKNGKEQTRRICRILIYGLINSVQILNIHQAKNCLFTMNYLINTLLRTIFGVFCRTFVSDVGCWELNSEGTKFGWATV